MLWMQHIKHIHSIFFSWIYILSLTKPKMVTHTHTRQWHTLEKWFDEQQRCSKKMLSFYCFTYIFFEYMLYENINVYLFSFIVFKHPIGGCVSFVVRARLDPSFIAGDADQFNRWPLMYFSTRLFSSSLDFQTEKNKRDRKKCVYRLREQIGHNAMEIAPKTVFCHMLYQLFFVFVALQVFHHFFFFSLFIFAMFEVNMQENLFCTLFLFWTFYSIGT